MNDLEFCAYNIVNQILDQSGADVAKRQSINDVCDDFARRLIRELVAEERKKIAREIQRACPDHMTRDYNPVDAAYDNAARIARGDL